MATAPVEKVTSICSDVCDIEYEKWNDSEINIIGIICDINLYANDAFADVARSEVRLFGWRAEIMETKTSGAVIWKMNESSQN